MVGAAIAGARRGARGGCKAERRRRTGKSRRWTARVGNHLRALRERRVGVGGAGHARHLDLVVVDTRVAVVVRVAAEAELLILRLLALAARLVVADRLGTGIVT